MKNGRAEILVGVRDGREVEREEKIGYNLKNTGRRRKDGDGREKDGC